MQESVNSCRSALALQIIEGAADAIVAFDAQLRCVFANPAAERLLGLKEPELLGRSQWEAFPATAGSPLEAACRRAMEQRIGTNLESFNESLQRWYEVQATPSQAGGLVVRFRDITERKRAEAELASYREHLEELVKERTSQLEAATAQLHSEIAERKEAEQRNRLLADLLERADQPFAVGYPDGRLGVANSAFGRLTGYSLDELRGIEWASALTPPEWREPERAKLDELQRTGGPVRYEKEYLRKDGTRVPIELFVHVVNDDQDRPLHYYAFVTDLTERKRAEEVLRESEERRKVAEAVQAEGRRFYDILEKLPVMVCLLTPDYQVPFANRRFREFFGESHGRHCYDYVSNQSEPCAECQSFTPLKTHAPHHWEWAAPNGACVDVYDFPFTDSDGSPLVLEVDIDITERRRAELELAKHREHLEELVKARTREQEAANAQLQAEIAERKQAEEALRESEKRLKRSQEIAHLGSWELDLVDNRLTWSDEVYRIFGLEPQEFGATYEAFLEAVHPEDRAAVDAAYSGSLRENQDTYEIEHRVVRKATGEVRFIHERCQHSRDASGRIVRSLGMVHDITERKQAEERLRHAQKLESIGVLAGGIAHDFNNLLTAILGNASLLQMEMAGSADQLRAITESSEKAASLTRQLLAYAGKGQFQITDFDVSRMVRSSDELLRVSTPKSIAVQLDVPRNLPAVRGDPSQIQQVVMNLVINAAEAIEDRKDGRVLISAGVQELDAVAASRIDSDIAPGRYIFITVRDNGCGMDEQTKAKIFDPFFTTKFTGRGLGLAAVHGILRSHKGTITVESSPGHGSTFTVYLPCSEARTAAADRKGIIRAGQAATVLVIDDEAPVRAFTKAALERLGYRVLLAENGRQALDLLHSHPGVDLVVLDIIMPVVGGVEAFGEIRKKWPNLTVLVASGYSRLEAQRLGIPRDLPFIEKPYTFQMLGAAVDKALKAPDLTEPRP